MAVGNTAPVHALFLPQSSGAVWKWRWTSWAPFPNKPTVSVDLLQHFNNVLASTTSVNTESSLLTFLRTSTHMFSIIVHPSRANTTAIHGNKLLPQTSFHALSRSRSNLAVSIHRTERTVTVRELAQKKLDRGLFANRLIITNSSEGFPWGHLFGVNPFTTPAESCTDTPANSIFPGPITHLLSMYALLWKSYHVPVRKRKQKA